jgi:LysM repeat protein
MSEEKNSNMFSNAKLSTIFLVVLGLHVVVIVLISAYHLLKGDPSVDMAQRMTMPEPRSYESILTDEADERSPEVVTDYAAADMTGQQNLPLSMPAADDPIWTGQAPVLTETASIDATRAEVANTARTVKETVTDQTPFRPTPMKEEPATSVTKATSTPNSSGAAVASGTTYTVVRGDTLSGIASRHGLNVSAIQQANGLNSSMIRIGQELKLPGVASVAAVKNQVTKPAPAAPKATVVSSTYTVGKGDTLWKISRKFSTTPQQIAELNGITVQSVLGVGDTLKVPVSRSAATGTVESSTDMAMIPGQ